MDINLTTYTTHTSIKVQIRTRAINCCSVDKYVSVKKYAGHILLIIHVRISIQIIATFTEEFKGNNYRR